MKAILGINAALYVGHPRPRPLPASLGRVIESIEVEDVADGQSGFQITFGAARVSSGVEYEALASSLLVTGARVIVTVLEGLSAIVLMDGIITDHWLDPAQGSGGARFVVTGADLTTVMDMDERQELHRVMNEAEIVAKLIARYQAYGLQAAIPSLVNPPLGMERPSVDRGIRAQRGTDLDYIYALADRFGYIFKVKPNTPMTLAGPFTSSAYWGPPRRQGLERRALSVATGFRGDVEGIHFSYDARAPVKSKADLQEATMDRQVSAMARMPTLLPLAQRSAFRGQIRQVLLDRVGGLSYPQAAARAQGIVNASALKVMTARGQIDTAAYGEILRAGDLVAVRGAGLTFDGKYAVDRIKHVMTPGDYQQHFTIGREGSRPLSPLVRP